MKRHVPRFDMYMTSASVPNLALPVLLLLSACVSRPAIQPPSDEQLEALRSLARPITGAASDYDDLIDLVGDNYFVLLGESTHGTREFYRERARLTRRLIEEKGFTVVVFEADWPDAYDLNEFIHGRGPASAEAALQTFSRFPRWMWQNDEIRELAEWMRTYNAGRREDPVGVYGMDLYSVKESAEDVIAFLKETDPDAATRAQQRYKCLQPYDTDEMDRYGAEVASDRRASCRPQVAAQLEEMRSRVEKAGRGHRPGDDRLISAWQNARVVANGEAYYRVIYAGGVASWNLRDTHMADTIDALATHLNEGAARPAKLIVWAHNSHLGDARVTERSELGEWNVGQLMRQRHDGQSVLIGFTTYGGTVRAAKSWGSEGTEQPLRPALPGSFSAMFHSLGIPTFTLPMRGQERASKALGGRKLERFVGVIYAPGTERESHYFDTDLGGQFDAIIHIDQTTALGVPARRLR